MNPETEILHFNYVMTIYVHGACFSKVYILNSMIQAVELTGE